MGILWWLVTLLVRLVLGLAVGIVAFVVGAISQAGRDDGDADWGRRKTIGPWRHDRHLVTPAIGRRGWTKR